MKDKKKENLAEEKKYLIQLIKLELDEKMFILLESKLNTMSYEDLCAFLEYLYDREDNDDTDKCEHIEKIDELEKKLKRVRKDKKDMKKVIDKLIEENDEEDEEIKRLKKRIKKLKGELKELKKEDGYDVTETDFFDKVRDELETAVYSIKKLREVGYTDANAEEIAKIIVLNALSADDKHDR